MASPHVHLWVVVHCSCAEMLIWSYRSATVSHQPSSESIHLLPGAVRRRYSESSLSVVGGLEPSLSTTTSDAASYLLLT